MYICTADCPRALLPNLDLKLIDQSNNTDLQTQLTHVAQSETTQLRVLKASAVSKLLDETMPSIWKNAMVVKLPNPQFCLEWFSLFWMWVSKKELSLFQNKLVLMFQFLNNSLWSG